MLLRVQVSNHRSIFEPVELSLIAVDGDRAATRGFDLLSERVLTVAGIYGPNASGKSNVLDAIAWLSAAVHGSVGDWQDDIPRDVHRFGEAPVSPTEFDLDIVVGGVRFTYRLEVDDSVVLHESLESYPARRRRNLFTRRRQDVDFRRGFAGAGGVRQLLTPSTLVLSAAMRVGDSAAGRVGRAIAETRLLGTMRKGVVSGSADSTTRLCGSGAVVVDPGSPETGMDPSTTGVSSVLDLLRFADPGVDGYYVTDGEPPHRDGPEGRVSLLHIVRDTLVAFDLDEESAGTQVWFRLLGPVLAALRKGRVLLFDEIDASLHPRLSSRLIEIFQDPRTNPHDAQLVFTSHDTSLLNSLNRDEVWLTEKESGATRLVALAEFGGERVRKSQNIERAYLQGRFGSVPEVDQAQVRRVLGLVSPVHGQG